MKSKNKKPNKKAKTITQDRELYSTDLTDAQWNFIAPLIPEAKEGGRPREVDIREVVNAIFYILKAGCEWRLLPHDFPQWKLVYHYFSEWKKNGAWKKIHDCIRGKLRRKLDRNTNPSAGILDSQSVKTTEKGGFVAMTLVRR